MNQEFERDLKAEAQAQIAKMQEDAQVHAELHVVAGHVAEAVHCEAVRHNADLVVIGRGVLHEKLGRLRTNAYAIIRAAPCPVLSV
jgi:nucleotide-binding universal stress UspA family protein